MPHRHVQFDRGNSSTMAPSSQASDFDNQYLPSHPVQVNREQRADTGDMNEKNKKQEIYSSPK